MLLIPPTPALGQGGGCESIDTQLPHTLFSEPKAYAHEVSQTKSEMENTNIQTHKNEEY